MGQLRGSSPFFRPGPPAALGNPDPEVADFLRSKSAGTVLDIGGGRGAYAHELQKAGFDVTLAEVDPECLESAQRAGIPVLDMNGVSWADLKGNFDTVLLVEVLEHIEDYRAFLRHALACARKKLLLTVPCNDDFEKLFAFGFTYNHIAVADHLNHFTTADVASLLDAEGCRYEIRTGSHLFPQPMIDLLRQELWGTLRGRLGLFSLKLFNKFGWLPRKLPARIFVEVTLPD